MVPEDKDFFCAKAEFRERSRGREGIFLGDVTDRLQQADTAGRSAGMPREIVQWRSTLHARWHCICTVNVSSKTCWGPLRALAVSAEVGHSCLGRFFFYIRARSSSIHSGPATFHFTVHWILARKLTGECSLRVHFRRCRSSATVPLKWRETTLVR